MTASLSFRKIYVTYIITYKLFTLNLHDAKHFLFTGNIHSVAKTFFGRIMYFSVGSVPSFLYLNNKIC